MTPIQQSRAAAQFAKEWANKGYEKGHTQTFWLELLQKVFGVENPYGYINFEDQVMVDSTNFMDGIRRRTEGRIEQTAQAILDTRAKYPDCSLADLYDDVAMPPELRKAHQDNDRAVMRAYGFTPGQTTESECVAKLFEMYQTLTH